MSLVLLKDQLGHQTEVEEVALDRQPSTIITSHRSTPLLQMESLNEDSMPKKPTLRARWRRFWQHKIDLYHPEPRRKVTYRLVVFLPLLCLLAFMLVILYFAVVSSILRALQPPLPNNGLQKIVDTWSGLGSVDLPSIDRHSFSASVTPIPCHSHNDYTRRVPLFEGLSIGCTSTEADVYVPPDVRNGSDLLVGHKRSALSSSHTLRALYLEPLLTILNAMNPDPSDLSSLSGPFSTSPSTNLTLLIDLKETEANPITQTFNLLNTNLTPLRAELYPTTYDPATNTLHRGPLTIVLTGSTTLDHITNSTLNPHHDLFLDAPLHALFPDSASTAAAEDSPYNITNSAMASTSLSRHIGGPSRLTGTFSASQRAPPGLAEPVLGDAGVAGGAARSRVAGAAGVAGGIGQCGRVGGVWAVGLGEGKGGRVVLDGGECGWRGGLSVEYMY